MVKANGEIIQKDDARVNLWRLYDLSNFYRTCKDNFMGSRINFLIDWYLPGKIPSKFLISSKDCHDLISHDTSYRILGPKNYNVSVP